MELLVDLDMRVSIDCSAICPSVARAVWRFPLDVIAWIPARCIGVRYGGSWIVRILLVQTENSPFRRRRDFRIDSTRSQCGRRIHRLQKMPAATRTKAEWIGRFTSEN